MILCCANKIFALLRHVRFRVERLAWLQEKPLDGGFLVINFFEERLLVGFCRLEQVDRRERIDRILYIV